MPLIKETTVQQVYELDLVAVVQHFVVDLKKSGANYQACCPFHDEKSPSFSVSAVKHVYKCFGCGKGGNNAVSFYMHLRKVEFIDAVKDLCTAFGIFIEYEEGEVNEKIVALHKIRAEIIDVNALALEYFISNLDQAKKELRCTPETAKHWEIGFAPAGWDGLRKFLNEKGDYFETAVKSGLLKVGESKKVFDFFRERVMFPIRDHRGKLCGFSGRTVLDSSKKNAKYTNSSDSEAFHKGNMLMGIHYAKEEIVTSGEANLVEGNWDVVRMHELGITNTVAGCGTALTHDHLVLLGKTCKAKRLLMLYDGDNAGITSATKNSIEAMKSGLVVDVIFFPDKHDPDSFFRDSKKKKWDAKGVRAYLTTNRKNFIVWKAEQYDKIKGDSEKAHLVQELCQLLAYVQDVFLRDALIEQVIETTGIVKRTLTKTVNTLAREFSRQDPENLIYSGLQDDNYEMPKNSKLQWREVRDDVMRYSFFTEDNIIYMRRGDSPYTFTAVSNFSIKIIQHMEDEKRPMRLVEIKNIYGRKRTFDTPSDDFVQELSFRKMLDGKGNYDWKGTGLDFSRLVSKLKDDMGDGRMITILGWQQEGFWVFNNAIILDGKIKPLDPNGCFEYAGESFYVPSGNKIYSGNDIKYAQQKRAMLFESKYSFNEVGKQLMAVHRNHAINALLFVVATAFSDLIFSRTNFFPIMFLYGEPGSGKDNLIHAMQSFFGQPQTAITITGKANTDKAKIRKFAQFINMMGHMTEYANGNEETDQMIKSMWDRVGYERGNIDSHVGTDSIEMKMSLVFTGNDYPTNDALITRFIGEEMNLTEFTREQKESYEKLKDMTIHGYSSLLADILKLRPDMEESFRKEFKAVSDEISPELVMMQLADRMIQNAAVLGACFKVTNKALQYPFTWEEFKDNIKKVYARQSNKRSTGSVVAHWWDCIIEAVKDAKEPMEIGHDFVLNGSDITLQFSQVYTKYLKMHYNLYRKGGLSKMVLSDKLKKSDAFIGAVDSIRYSSNSKSSGYQFDLKKAGVLDDFLAAMDTAKSFRRIPSMTPSIPAATASQVSESKEADKNSFGEQQDLPFNFSGSVNS